MEQAEKTKLWYLKKIKLFSSLSEDEMAEMGRITSMESVKKRQPLYLPGDPGDNVFLLKSGRVKVSQISEDGKEFTLAILEPGEIFGELEVFEGTQRDTMAEALEDTSICVIKKRDFEELLKKRPDLTLRLTKMIGLRLRRLESRITDLVFKDVPSRLAHLLLRLSGEFGVRDGAAIRLTIGITHQQMANLIGSTRETVTAILGDFKRQGLISLDERRVVILREKELEHLTHPRS